MNLKTQMFQIELHNTTKFRVSAKEIQKIANACQKVLPISDAQISLAIVGDKQMHKLNKTHRKKDVSTDVLSFPYPEASKGEFAGEVIINHVYLKKNAKELGYSLSQEFAGLLVHGVVHVFGYDHMKPKQAKEMFAMEKRILNHLV